MATTKQTTASDAGEYPDSVSSPSSPVSSKGFKESLKDLAVSSVSSLADGFLKYGFDALNRWHEERQQRKMMREQFRLNEESQRRMMANMAESYKRAGLSTGLLSEGSFSPAQVSVPSVPEKHTRPRDVSMLDAPAALQMQSNLESQAAERGVANAEKERIDAEAEHQRILNARLRDEDETFNQDARMVLEEQIQGLRDIGDDELADNLQVRLDDGRFFTRGSADAINFLLDYHQAQNDYERQFYANQVANAVAQMMFYSDDVKSAMAAMPFAQLKALDAEIKTASARIADLYADAALKSKQKGLTDAEVKKIQAEADAIIQDMDISKRTNLRYAMATGDKGSIVSNGTYEILAFVPNLVPWFGAGRMLKGMRRVPSSAAPVDIPTRTGTGFGKGLSPIELSKIPVSERRKAAQIELNSWKNSHRQASSKEIEAQRIDIGYKYGIDMSKINRRMRAK